MKLTTLLTLALTPLLVTSTPLLTPRSDVRVDAGSCDKGVIGSANWDWWNSDAIQHLSISVRDCDCDHDVYIQVLNYIEKTGETNVLQRWSIKTDGCDKKVTWNPGKLAWLGPVPKWRIRVCKVDKLKDTCYYSPWKVNPYK